MPGNPSSSEGGPDEVRGASSEQTELRGRGRTRYCKKCSFTCTDAREFTAHQTSHSDVTDDQQTTSSSAFSSSQDAIAVSSTRYSTALASASTASELTATAPPTTRRTLRSKRFSRSNSDMAPPPAPGPDTTDAVSDTSGQTTKLETNEDSLVSADAASECASKPEDKSVAAPKLGSGAHDFEVKPRDIKMEEEGGDEPDSMVNMSRDKLESSVISESEKSKTQNGMSGYFSGDEEMEDEGKLVIDDDNNTLSSPNRAYSCQPCGFSTTSSKTYLRHCNEIHNAQTTIYECDKCDYATIYKQKLSKHRELHTEGDVQMNDTIDLTAKSPVDKMTDSDNNFLGVSSQNTSRLATPDNSSMLNNGDDDMEAYNDAPSLDPIAGSVPLTITTENIDQVLDDDKKKKKKTRQEVDPGKYFEAVDGSGTKYACSQCGNIYKWRKSLNKHWKEKHLKDPLVEEPSPPGMLELLKSGKYTQLGARRIYDNAFLATIKTQKGDTRPPSSPGSDARSPSPPNFLTTAQSMNSINASRLVSAASAMMPKMIGPFVANSAQPVFPGMPIAIPHLPMQNGFDTSGEEGALDLTRDAIKTEIGQSPFSMMAAQNLSSSFDQDQPLDFSKKNGQKSSPHVKNEKLWEEMNNPMKHTHSINQYIPKVRSCSKCDYTSTSEIDFANHTSSHLNKRIVRCFECKLQLNSMDELNTHFIKLHNKKLSDHKEAIKKIPHGLQQTYHLLQMDIDKIGDLGSQDLGATDSKSLKCKKCDFEAKWPAELQKHAVSHSEERPYICMVCGSTYKWKWDLVKHFQKSHPNLPNPYRRNDKRETPDASSEDEHEEEPEAKRARFSAADMAVGAGAMNGAAAYNRDDAISVEGIIKATQIGQLFVSSQPHLDDESSLERNPMAFLNAYPYLTNGETAKEFMEKQANAQRAMQESLKNRQSGSVKKTPTKDQQFSPGSSSSSSSTKNEELPYKCTQCNYHARWPSEVTQHMKNHSDSKPYLCPRCEYRSKWKWDVVKHLKRCGGGGGIEDVIDTTKTKRRDNTSSSAGGPPNAVVSQQGKVKKTTPQPPMAYIMPSVDENGQPSAVVLRPSHGPPGMAQTMSQLMSSDDQSRSRSNSASLDTSNNNNDSSLSDNNVNNNYVLYSSGQSLPSVSPSLPATPSTTFTPITPTIASQSPAPSPASHSSNSRQNSNAEMWTCPHCPFTTQSQAELKRHSGLHSEDKPFKCDVCHYSTRWACDLKKHRRSYNHFPQNKSNTSINNTPDKSAQVKDSSDKLEKVINRFKCFQCNIFFPQLQNLMDHRRALHIGSESAQSSPVPPAEEVEIDAARIKHPRKPIKQIQCPKCPFVCRNRNTMDKHMEEHELQEMNAFKCFYCTQHFKDKESLLDHIISHPTFTPKEWETFFMINEEEEEEQLTTETEPTPSDAQQTKKNISEVENQTSQVMKEMEKVSSKNDATEARIQQILNEIPKQQKQTAVTAPSQQPQSTNKFKCEWCPAEFVNLTAVYKHASQAHPIQLKEQDVSMALASQSAHAKAQAAQEVSQKKGPYASEPIEILRQQIAEKRNQQMMEKFNELFATNPKFQEVLSKKMEEEKSGAKRFQCDKCSFSSSNMITFQRHYELHGSKMQSQCWFCDYSVDRMNLLYQHMKISHTRKWKALSQDPKYASQIQKMNLAFSTYKGNESESNASEPPAAAAASPATGSGAIDLSAKAPKSSSEVAHDIVYLTRQQYTWSDIPVNVVPVGSALNFVCPNCSYNDASIAKTCSHVMQSHRAMTKFKCKTCSFSDDNIHVMSDHCKTSHPISERVVEVVDFKQLNFSELQMVQLNAMRERMSQEMTSAASAQQSSQDSASLKKSMNCPFCPYTSQGSEEMKSHLSNHSKQARYRCQLCDFSSDLTTVISEHVKVHDPSYAATTTANKSHKEASETNSAENLTSPARGTDLSVPQVKTEPELELKMKASEAGGPDSPRGVSGSLDLTKDASPKMKPSGRIRYRCSVCPYHTTCKSNILKHKRQHLHNKRYKCYKCSYSAARAVLLKNHLEAHDIPVDDDGQHHDIFCNPNSPNDHLRSVNDDNEMDQDTEIEVEDIDDDDDTNSDDLENEMDAKAIADLEAKHIMEAEASLLIDDELPSNGESPGDKPLRRQKCQHCPFSSNSAYEFRKHQNFHGTQERYKCDLCSYSLDRLNLLSQHRKLHCDEPGYNPNPPASALLNTSFILQQNAEQAQAENDIDCETKTDPNSDQFRCAFCPYKAAKKSLLDTHITSHGLKKRFICDFCDWSADRIELVRQHRRVHESEPDFNPNCEEKNFLNEEFDDGGSGEFEAKYTEIKGHEKGVGEGENESASSPPFKLTVVKKSYPCRLCPFKTKSRTSYSVHKSMHGSGAKFSCPECSYSVVSRGLLQQHMHLHTAAARGETTSPQPPASKTGEMMSKGSEGSESGEDGEAINLTSKSSTDCKTPPNQTGEKVSDSQLLCSFCPFTSTSANALAEHLKTHCGYRATSKSDLYPHQQTHFPDSVVELITLDKKVAETLANNNNNNNNLTSPPGEGKNRVPEQTSSEPAPSTEKTAPTRIYVCRYCDREFEAKATMLQHEKQHLVGTQ